MHIINPYRYAGGGGGLTIENYTTATDDSITTSITATDPGSISSGDLLVIIAVARTSTTTVYTTPAGWTKLREYGSGNAHHTVLYKTASGSEGDVVFTTIAVNKVVWYLRITGANATPIDVTSASSNNRQALSVTTTVDDCLAFAVLAYDGGTEFPHSTSSTGWTIDGNGRSGAISISSSGAWATQAMPTAGATGNCLFDQATDGSSCMQFAIAPA